ncbi:unnamed protein product [Phytophthora fragariaefolia]|uniref:Unnamed protein product n=1 Tax=Phytophthora fragariaefolia TaxID=1490495 RepID=A0A9W6YP47_9STRA|nr:unnamed protein product [Phytophthora fragariaefolia]
MLRSLLTLSPALAELVSHVAGSSLYKVWIYYAGKSCDGTPYNTYAESNYSCTIASCIEDGNTSATGVGVASIDCTSDYQLSTRNAFGSSPYIFVEVFTDSNCQTFSYAQGFFASGNCEGSPNLNSSQAAHVIAKLQSDGSAVLDYYHDATCDSSSLYATYSVDAEALGAHQCDENWSKWHYVDGDDSFKPSTSSSPGSDEDTSASQSGGIKMSVVVGIIVGGGLVLAFVALGFCCCSRRSKSKPATQQQPTASLQSRNTASLDMALRGQTGLWNDDVITAKRISRDKVRVKKIVSRGGFGEVCDGMFNGKRVAIKRLLPETRGKLQHVNEFLAEAKLTAAMDHPHIVAFIGVAWDSLSDVCVVLEFMDGGDLRALLNSYEDSRHPVGFDTQKTTIALHVCHALTYLHSLMPPVIHRDLKSRNILLNRAMEAKITDFGISRERLDQTMTAGVGTSLWMAPEVMLGERYDVKADMFSFGVVLSELDVHTLPYTHSKEQNCDSNGRRQPDAAILQQVAMGALHVEFSDSCLRSIMELGFLCVSLNPNDRPTAAEALYRLQIIMSREMV